MWGNTFGVSQGSIIGPILFKLSLSDLFLVISDSDFSSYADDNTLYDSGNCIDDVISSLQESSEKLFQWFSYNQMKGNTYKFHLVVSTDKSIEIKVGVSVVSVKSC